MPATGGRLAPTPTVPQTVTVGHPQDLVFFIHSNHGVEDTLQASGGMLGVGFGVRTNGAPGTPDSSPLDAHAHMYWSGNVPTGGFLTDLISWARGGPEGALSMGPLGTTSFDLHYSPSGGFQNASGTYIYWLAITGEGEDEDLVTAKGNFNAAIPSITTTFPPTASIQLGIGTNSVATGSFAQSGGWATPTWGIWSKDFDSLEGIDRGPHLAYAMSTEAYNNFSSHDWFYPRQFVYDNQLVLRSFATSAFGYSADDTHLYNNYHYPGGAWVGDYGRVGVAVMGGIVARSGVVTPSSTVGGIVTVQLPFDPVAVIFMADSDGNMPHGGDDWAMGASIGFVAKENGFQAVVCAGGQHAISMARYQSPNRAWVSNFTGASGSGIHAGTAEFIEGDSSVFTMTTTENGRSAREVMYTAFGFPVEAPGFFRILNR